VNHIKKNVKRFVFVLTLGKRFGSLRKNCRSVNALTHFMVLDHYCTISFGVTIFNGRIA
jgi:hypothetical protein